MQTLIKIVVGNFTIVQVIGMIYDDWGQGSQMSFAEKITAIYITTGTTVTQNETVLYIGGEADPGPVSYCMVMASTDPNP